MDWHCAKCGHKRKATDPPPDTECPNCGNIYAEQENQADSIRRNLARIKRAEAKPAPGPATPYRRAAPTAPTAPATPATRSEWRDIAEFRAMVTPAMMKAVFWLGFAFLLVAGLVTLIRDHSITGVGIILFGPMAWRMAIEMLILPFSIHESLEAIRRLLEERRTKD